MKKILTLIIVLAVLLGGGWLIITKVVIDTEKMAAQLSESISQATGREVKIEPEPEITLWPWPQVAYSKLRVANVPSASTEYMVISEEVIMKLDPFALLTFRALPGEMILVEPVFELETLPNGSRNWQFAGGNRSAGAFSSYFKSVSVKVQNGTLRYTNAALSVQSEFPKLDGTLGFQDGGTMFGFDGTIGLHDDKAKVVARLRSVDLTQESTPETPLQFRISKGGLTVTTNGTLANASRDFKYTGDIELKAANFWALPAFFSGEKSPYTEKLDFSPELVAKGKLAFSTKGMTLQGGEFEAATAGAIPAIKGVFDLDYTFGKDSKLRFTPTIATMDLDHLLAAQEKWFPVDEAPAGTPEDMPEDGSEEEKENKAMFANTSGELAMKLDNVILRGRSISQVELIGVIEEGELLIERGHALFPGKSEIALFGVTKRTEDGLWFDGKLDMQGESLEQFISVFAPKGVEIPPLDLGRFVVRTNLAYNPKQFRLSEAQAAFKHSRAAGAFIVHRGDRLRIESFLRIAGLDLDVVSEAANHLLPDTGVQSKASEDGSESLFNVQYVNTRHNWLASVGADIKADLVLDDFVLWERKGESAKFRLEVGLGQAKISGLDAQYGGQKITGDFGIRLENGKNPFVDIAATFSDFDMVDIIPELARTQNDDEWRTFLDKNLEFLLFQTYRGRVVARFNQLTAKHFVFENAETELLLDNNTLTLDRFGSTLWNGQLEMRATIQTGTIPSFASSVSLSNINLYKLSQTTPLLKHAAGLVGLRGQLSTSGITLRNWIKNAEGALTVAGRDVSVQGFGLSTLARAVPLARSVADLQNAKDLAVVSGSTLFRDMNGQIIFKEGLANIPAINFTSEESQGSFDGRVDLIQETVDLVMRFYLISTVDNGQAPGIKLVVKGPINKLKKELETQELDAYVARKAAERALRTTQ